MQELNKFEIDSHNVIINQVLYDEEGAFTTSFTFLFSFSLSECACLKQELTIAWSSLLL